MNYVGALPSKGYRGREKCKIEIGGGCQRKIEILVHAIFEPTNFESTWWARMHRFPYVCLCAHDLTKIQTGPKVT